MDSRIPAQSTFVQLLGKRITKEELKIAEQTLLKLLDWKLIQTTPYDLISYYISLGLVFTTDEKKPDEKLSDKFFLYNVAPAPDFINDPIEEAPNTPDEVEPREIEEREQVEREANINELAYIVENEIEEDDGILENLKEVAKFNQVVARQSTGKSVVNRNNLQALVPRIERQALIICDELLRGKQKILRES